MLRRVLVVAAALFAMGRAERIIVRPHGRGRAAAGRRVFKSAAVLLAAAGIPGARAEEVAEEEEKSIFVQFDTNGDGKLDEAEFVAGSGRHIQESDPELVEKMAGYHKRLFGACDVDDDGFLTEREMQLIEFLGSYALTKRTQQRMMRMVGQEVDDELEDEFGLKGAESELKKYDEAGNGNGVIDKDEFMTAMKETAVSWGWSNYLDDPEVNQWLEDLFVQADITGDGVLNTKEVQYTSLLGDEAYRRGVFADRSLANIMFKDLDANEDGKIDEAELSSAMAELEERRAKAKAEADAAAAETAADGEAAATDEAAEAEEEEEKDERPKTLIEGVHKHFAEADADGDKTLDRQEAATLAKRLIGIPGEL